MTKEQLMALEELIRSMKHTEGIELEYRILMAILEKHRPYRAWLTENTYAAGI